MYVTGVYLNVCLHGFTYRLTCGQLIMYVHVQSQSQSESFFYVKITW